MLPLFRCQIESYSPVAGYMENLRNLLWMDGNGLYYTGNQERPRPLFGVPKWPDPSPSQTWSFFQPAVAVWSLLLHVLQHLKPKNLQNQNQLVAVLIISVGWFFWLSPPKVGSLSTSKVGNSHCHCDTFATLWYIYICNIYIYYYIYIYYRYHITIYPRFKIWSLLRGEMSSPVVFVYHPTLDNDVDAMEPKEKNMLK